MSQTESATFVVVGGGIAGVSCVEALLFWAPEEKIILITASPLIKSVTNVVRLTNTLAQFDVEEKNADTLSDEHQLVKVVHDCVESFDSNTNTIYTSKQRQIKYKKLCLCTGGEPKIIARDNPFVIGIRDTDSVIDFKKRVSNARRMVIVGNGGIATEVVYEVTGVEKIWVVKDQHVNSTFIDAGAAEFLQNSLTKTTEPTVVSSKRIRYQQSENTDTTKVKSAALGPDWHANMNIQGLSSHQSLVIEYGCTVDKIEDGTDWPVNVTLSNGKMYGCDFLISATGVTPNAHLFPSLDLANDGGVKVNWQMETNLPDIYAAGDVATASWPHASHWQQMRLWTQARQMGEYAAKTMAHSLTSSPVLQDFCFELFSHVTKFFGFKVVLLGLFNGQKLNNNYDLLLRVTKGKEYIKLVMKDGKMQGAVLIGETDLEEMCENLILNQLDLSSFGEDLLNPDIDIEDYFD